MLTLFSVALGGAIGAVLRFLITKIPGLTGYAIPWMTLTANLIGALIIGFIAGSVVSQARLSPNQMAFLKTGFCGGLTTFSTFSLESFELIQHGKYGMACIYAILSVFLCLIGVMLGRAIAVRTFA